MEKNFYMELSKKVETKLLEEFKIEDKELSQILLMKRKEQIIQNHINNVCNIYPPTGADGAKRYWMTKLTPTQKNKHCIYAKTEDELHTKIIAYYLEIEHDNNITMKQALDFECENLSESNAERVKKFFNSNLKQLTHIKCSKLTIEQLNDALSNVYCAGECKQKRFSGTVTALHKIADYCSENSIPCIDIYECIKTFKQKHINNKKRAFIPINTDVTQLVFTEAETIAILEYAIKHPDFKILAIALLLTTGLRVGELLAIKISDIHLNEERIHICRMENVETQKIYENCKDNSIRDVMLNDDAVTIIKLVLDIREKMQTKSEWLFLNDETSDEKLHHSALDTYIRKIQSKKYLNFKNPEKRSAHDCRRTYASIQYFLLGDKALFAISGQLGHKSIAQTWDYIFNIVEPKTRKDILKNGTLLKNND